MVTIEWEHIAIRTLPDQKGVPEHFWMDRVKEVPHPELSAIYVLPDREEASRFAAEKILEVVVNKPDAAITLPSSNQGNSVLEKVVSLARERGVSFADVHFFHLDEYFPITADHADSFRKNLREKIWGPLEIPAEHIHEIKADPGMNGDEAAAAYEAEIAKYDIDLVLHPIGPDGHMAFDEAGTPRDSVTHLAKLSDKTVYRDRVIRKLDSPDHAITQGIGTIMRAKKILFIDFSPDYKEFMKDALYGPVSEDNPSSLLRTIGSKVEVVMTREIAAHVLPA
jgi:glucosamine-6-phosphate deaminase